MTATSLDKMCVICTQAFNDNEHILWFCAFAKSIWLEVLAWWEIRNRLPVFVNFQVWSWLNWFKNHSIKTGWGITIVAVLWSLWLNRNRNIFEAKQYSLKELVMLIKIRSFRWCQVLNLVHENALSCWSVNPEGLIASHLCSVRVNLFGSNSTIYGCTDGSFVRTNALEYKAGMGVFLKNRDNELLFLFSGPLKVSSALQAEMLAVNHMVKNVVSSMFSQAHCIIYMDSEEALNLIRRIKASLDTGILWMTQVDIEILRNSNITFRHVSRHMNVGADDLAKQGLNRKVLIQGWF